MNMDFFKSIFDFLPFKNQMYPNNYILSKPLEEHA